MEAFEAITPLFFSNVRPIEKSRGLPWTSVTLPPASVTKTLPDA
jgi:hypothetical protein